MEKPPPTTLFQSFVGQCALLRRAKDFKVEVKVEAEVEVEVEVEVEAEIKGNSHKSNVIVLL